MTNPARQPLPSFLYGTAWKEDDTERLTRMALEAGFRGIDTANQRKHYYEEGVGAAVSGAIDAGMVRRDELFLQTKFTYRSGQDHRLPYDAAADVATQVRQSFEKSLQHLRVERIDSYVLHGPSQRRGLSSADRAAWRTMEELHSERRVRFIGVSNVALDQLEELMTFARVKPSFVQNRCFARDGWDRQARVFCKMNAITYQGFSLLTANAKELQRAAFTRIVDRVVATPAQVVFAFALRVGMLPLTGTTDQVHMREDLSSGDVELSDEDVRLIEEIGE